MRDAESFVGLARSQRNARQRENPAFRPTPYRRKSKLALFANNLSGTENPSGHSVILSEKLYRGYRKNNVSVPEKSVLR